MANIFPSSSVNVPVISYELSVITVSAVALLSSAVETSSQLIVGFKILVDAFINSIVTFPLSLVWAGILYSFLSVVYDT